MKKERQEDGHFTANSKIRQRRFDLVYCNIIQYIMIMNDITLFILCLCAFTGPAPPAATVVIVVCIAALVVIVVIGVYRIHATHQEGSRDDDEGSKESEEDWENSALTITVNPMEVG